MFPKLHIPFLMYSNSKFLYKMAPVADDDDET